MDGWMAGEREREGERENMNSSQIFNKSNILAE